VRRLLGTASLAHEEGSDLIAPLQSRLDAIERRLAELTQHTQAFQPATPQVDQQVAIVKDALVTLEKQISRAGREQLKANSLAEAQIEQLTAALEALRAADSRREAEMAALREQVRQAETADRLEIVRSLLPALDGIDEALRAGQQLLEQQPPPPVPSTPFERMRARIAQAQRPDPTMREALAAWLVGITFVRQRLLDVLAADHVHPIHAQGQPFDPQLHVAVEVVPAGPQAMPGTVVAELRRGYLAGQRVLRHAEVAVASET
jgi:molecular chaperone GrpE